MSKKILKLKPAPPVPEFEDSPERELGVGVPTWDELLAQLGINPDVDPDLSPLRTLH